MEDGYLGLDIDGESRSVMCIDLAFNATAVIVLYAIALIAFSHMRHEKELNMSLKICFAINFLSALFFTIGSTIINNILVSVLDGMLLFIIWFITISSINTFFWSLLLTLILRLYATFKSSQYAMSRRLIVIFMTAMVLIALGIIVFSVFWAFDMADMPILKESKNQLYGFFTVLFLLYIMVSVSAIYLFVSNLSKLTEDLVRTLRGDVLDVDTIRDVALSPSQESLSNVSAKYMMLFGFAIITTIAMSGMAFSVNYDSNLRSVFHVVDLCINLWCLYLQFSFAQHHYRKCCGWCDARCRNMKRRKTQSAVHRRSLEIQESRPPSTVVSV